MRSGDVWEIVRWCVTAYGFVRYGRLLISAFRAVGEVFALCSWQKMLVVDVATVLRLDLYVS